MILIVAFFFFYLFGNDRLKEMIIVPLVCCFFLGTVFKGFFLRLLKVVLDLLLFIFLGGGLKVTF